MSKTIEIRWHGRGGQGAITAAKIVANTAFQSGYDGIIMAPSFGTERRGAPISTSLKISKSEINDLTPIEKPDIVIVLDHLLLDEEDVTAGLKPGGILVLNTPKTPEDYHFKNIKLAIVDVTAISDEAGLRKGIVNSGIIGALAKASNLLDMDLLLENIKKEFQGRKPEENAHSARLTFERTELKEV
ncbi:2-oxoacid:acceptor oxidoreductase family protein [bacterium]|nr:2-oxoacid:acceptor oxidoreductase family protein [bacterium]